MDADGSGDDCSGFVPGDPASCGDCDWIAPVAAVSFLESDYTLPCTDTAYGVHYGAGLVLMILIPLGIPVSFGVSIWRHRAEIKEHKGPHYLENIYGPFRPECCMWEMYFLLQKATLIGLLIFVDRGSILQSLVGLVIAEVMMLSIAKNRPYNSLKTNVLAMWGQLMVAIAYYSSMLLKIDLEGELLTRDIIGYIILGANAPMVLYFLYDTRATIRDELHSARISLLRAELGGDGATYRCIHKSGVDTTETMRKKRPVINHIKYGELVTVSGQAIDFHSGGAVARLQTPKGWCHYNHHGAVGGRYFNLVSTRESQGEEVGTVSITLKRESGRMVATVTHAEIQKAVEVETEGKSADLKSHLDTLTISALQKRARALKVKAKAIDKATDAEDSKTALSDVIVAAEVRKELDDDAVIGEVYVDVCVNGTSQSTPPAPLKSQSGATWNDGTGQSVAFVIEELETVLIKAHFVRHGGEDDGHPIGVSSVAVDKHLEEQTWEETFEGEDAVTIRAELGEADAAPSLAREGEEAEQAEEAKKLVSNPMLAAAGEQAEPVKAKKKSKQKNKGHEMFGNPMFAEEEEGED